jgi:hypothetical protein
MNEIILYIYASRNTQPLDKHPATCQDINSKVSFASNLSRLNQNVKVEQGSQGQVLGVPAVVMRKVNMTDLLGIGRQHELAETLPTT